MKIESRASDLILINPPDVVFSSPRAVRVFFRTHGKWKMPPLACYSKSRYVRSTIYVSPGFLGHRPHLISAFCS